MNIMNPEYLCPACEQPIGYHRERGDEDSYGRTRIYLVCPPPFPSISDMLDSLVSFTNVDVSKTAIGFIVMDEFDNVQHTYAPDLDNTTYDTSKNEIFIALREVMNL